MNGDVAASTRPVVAVDLDEVLGQFTAALVAFHNEAYGTSLKQSDFHSYEFHEVWGGTASEASAKVLKFFKSRYFADGISLIDGAQQGIKHIKHELDVSLHVVTSRQNMLEPATTKWINQHFPGLFDGIHFGNHYATEGRQISKPELCRRIGASVLIDDSMKYARHCSAAGMKVILFGDYPWNQGGSLPPGVVRVTDWQHAIQVLPEMLDHQAAWHGMDSERSDAA